MKNFFIALLFIFLICSSSQAQRILLSQGFENGPYTADSLPVKWAKVKVIPSTCIGPPTADWRARDSGQAFCGTNPLPAYMSKAFNTKRGLSIPWTSGSATLCDDWVFTDSLRIATGDSLIFWVQLGTYPAGATYYLDSLQIWITSGQTPASQIQRLATVTSLPQASNFWQEKKYDLSAYNGQRVYVAFRYYMNVSVDGIMVNVDSVRVRNLSAAPPSCNFNWTNQTSGTTQSLLSVSAVSNDVGWAAGNGPTVVRTINGTTWTSATGTGISGPVYNIWGINDNTALCTTTPAATTFIYRTSNGGTTWTQVFSQSGGFIDAIKMLDATTGYAMGDPVGGFWVLLKTTNGGVNWAQMPGAPAAPAGEAGWNNSFDVEGNNMWWLSNTATGKVYRSTNGGTNFSTSITGLATSSYGSIKFAANGLVGIVTSTTGTAVKSIDGGATWTPITTVPGGGCTAVETGLNGTNIDFYGTGGTTIQRSTNGGTNWSLAFTATGSINDLYFTTFNGCPVGWAVGVGGAIAKMSLITGISNYNTEIPSAYSLNQNYPNPFNPSTNINFAIPKSGLVTLKIYDMVGREVAILVNEYKNAGNYIVGFNASDLTSGTYFYRLESNDFIATKKMLLVK